MSGNINVLIIAQLFPPDMGGGATRAYNVAKGLLEAGCEVTVLSAFPHYPTGNIPAEYKWRLLGVRYDGKLKIIRTYVLGLASEGLVKRILLFFSFALSSIFALPLIRRVNVVWAANPNIIAMFPGLVYKIVHRCPLIQNVDDLWPETLYDLGLLEKSLLTRIGEFIARLVYRLASAITPISPAYVDVLTKKYKIDSSRILVLSAGVDLTKFQPAQQPLSTSKNFRVLYVGAFSLAYNFRQVVRAAKLLSSHPYIEFILQGGGELAGALKTMVAKTGLSNIRVIEKIFLRREVADILRTADALLLPLGGKDSIELGISSKLYEYQAVGKPILCCSRGQPGLYVMKSKSGIVIEPGDYEALAKSVLALAENPDLATEFGENGRRYVERNHSISKIGLKMKALIFKVLKGRKVHGRR